MMDLQATILAAIYGLVAGIIYGIIFYAKAAVQNKEDFDLKKFVTTLTLGALIGIGMSIFNIPITEGSFTDQMAVYGFMTVVIEAFLKIFFKDNWPTSFPI